MTTHKTNKTLCKEIRDYLVNKGLIMGIITNEQIINISLQNELNRLKGIK